uniref:CRAL-TRIO domain-containing protein n=1 Tax=Syphacia muris TaxID=451379 RepID=A0A0N5A8Q3_9BILA
MHSRCISSFFQTQDLQYEKYDTDYNLLRWAQGYNFDMELATIEFRRHLKFRRFYDLDNIIDSKENKSMTQFFPLGLVGKTGKDNHLLVVECAGRIDLQGIMKTFQLSVFLEQRLRFQEMMMKEINRMEAINKKQCSVIYILDLEGLKLDPKLLTVVTGPYKILWTLVYTNYPEWIDTLFVVNAPSFVPYLWKAIAPLLPERTRDKVRIPSKANYIKELEKYCDLKYVPKHWGGYLIDKNGDPMCRDRLIIPTNEIPKSMYWTPSADCPHHTDLECVTMGPGQGVVITYKVYQQDGPIIFTLNRYSERVYYMAIYHSVDENGADAELEKMDDWSPEFLYPWMPSVDLVQSKAPGPGIYKLEFKNPQTWFRSLTVYYRVRFVNELNEEVHYERINE